MSESQRLQQQLARAAHRAALSYILVDGFRCAQAHFFAAKAARHQAAAQ